MKKIVEVKNISKKINNKLILDNISFDGYEGEIIGLVGNNGAGKSTLLKIMCGLYNIDSGEILYDGISLKNNYEKAISFVGSLIENPDMYKNLSGKRNIQIFKSMFRDIDENRINDLISYVQMEKNYGKKFKTYSLGMKERLGIAQALINKPKILILDEPTNGLDPQGIICLRKMLLELKDTTIIISSHMLSEIENLCNKIIFINNGKIIKINTIDKTSNKKRISFEVNDYSKAKLLLNNYCIGEDLTVYENDETISKLNRELVLNNIDVYRIIEYNIEKDFINLMGNNDKIS